MADANQEHESNSYMANNENNQTISSDAYVFVVVGATGNFAVNCILPSLWLLYKHKYLPPNTTIIGYSKEEFTNKAYAERVCPYFRHTKAEKELIQCFFSHVIYFRGSYDCRNDVQLLGKKLEEIGKQKILHVFYQLSLPPDIYESCTLLLKQEAMSKSGKTLIAMEQPFAKDLVSLHHLHDHLRKHFMPDQIFLQDHYLGKEMILSLFSLRFGNPILENIWNKKNIASILVNIEETTDVSEGSTFDELGIIKSQIMTHMMQIIAIIAMDQPEEFNTKSIRKAKLKLFSKVSKIKLNDVVLGQYIGNSESTVDRERESYKDHPNIKSNSVTPTFAVVIVFINNKTWSGVPFICKCGRAMRNSKKEIRIQFKGSKNGLFSSTLTRNELVIHFDPGAIINLKMQMKSPGIEYELGNVFFKLSYSDKQSSIKLPNSFARLLYEMLTGKRTNFVTFEEVTQVFKVFDSVLKRIQDERLVPLSYIRGSDGPIEAFNLISKNNYLDEEKKQKK